MDVISRRIHWAVLLLLLLLLSLASLRATASETQNVAPTAVAIFDSALGKFESDRAALRKWQYHQTLTTHQFDRAGKVVAKGTWRSIVRPGDPRPLEYIAESMEGKLSFFKSEPAQSAPTPKSYRDVKSKPTHQADEKNQAESAIEAVRKYNLRDRYLWKHLPTETVAGESAYVLSFAPKPEQNTTSHEERFFGLLAGRLWVSRSDFSVLKAEAALQAPCHLFWIIARVTTFRVKYELVPNRGRGRLFRSSKASATTVVTFPFYGVRQRHWLTADRFEPRTPRGSHTLSP